MNTIPLCKLPKGKTGLIQGISCPPGKIGEKRALIQRLLDLGFCQNTPVSCVNTGMFHNPRAYLIRGSVIALRNQDARMIQVACREETTGSRGMSYEKL